MPFGLSPRNKRRKEAGLKASLLDRLAGWTRQLPARASFRRYEGSSKCQRWWMLYTLSFLSVFLIATVSAWRFYHTLEAVIVRKFATHRWEIPSKVYARPVLLYPGVDIQQIELIDQLARLHYRQVAHSVQIPGEYLYDPQAGLLEIYLHKFTYPTHQEYGTRVRLFLQANQITRIEAESGQGEVQSVGLEPEVIAGVYGSVWKERRVVSLDEVPARLVQAVLAAEDQRFFTHHGIDVLGILRAAWANLRAVQVVQGGSTLTQQLVKNFFFTHERTISRKLLETVTAIIVENHYSKFAILTRYLNEIYFGQRGAKGIFGVWEAARFYFGKELRDLSLGEMATLAGLVRAPNYYAPHRHPDRARQRRDRVLWQMRELAYITEREYQVAVAEPITERMRTPESRRNVNSAPYFVDFVTQKLAETYPSEDLATAGFRIFTSLDMRLQRMAEQALKAGLRELEHQHPQLQRQEPGKRVQGSLIAIQPQTGEIRAMVGGRDYRISQFNRVTQAHRQPGSIFKPFVYLAALEQERHRRSGRFLPTTLVKDQQFTWNYKNEESWTPANYQDHYLGIVTLRQAVEHSLNAATVRIAQAVGLGPIQQMAKILGITSPLPSYPSLALGTAEVTPLEVAQAFAVLANQGIQAPSTTVTAVMDRHDATVQRHLISLEQVLSPQTSYLMTHMLEGVLERGTGKKARAQGFDRPAAGKTGTTDDYADAWFVGYTPELVTVVWVGFDDGRESLQLSGSQAALPIWVEFMKRATKDTPVQEFSPPFGVSVVAIDPATGLRATPSCPLTIQEAFFAGQEPTSPCPQHSTITVASSFIDAGRRRMAVGDYQGASVYFKQAVTTAPTEPQSYFLLAKVLFYQRHYQQALQFLTEAEHAFGSNPTWQGEVYNLRGAVYEELGDRARAYLAYKHALRFAPQNLSALSGVSRLALAETNQPVSHHPGTRHEASLLH